MNIASLSRGGLAVVDHAGRVAADSETFDRGSSPRAQTGNRRGDANVAALPAAVRVREDATFAVQREGMGEHHVDANAIAGAVGLSIEKRGEKRKVGGADEDLAAGVAIHARESSLGKRDVAHLLEGANLDAGIDVGRIEQRLAGRANAHQVDLPSRRPQHAAGMARAACVELFSGDGKSAAGVARDNRNRFTLWHREPGAIDSDSGIRGEKTETHGR